MFIPTLAITDDNWNTVKTAVGAYYYYHPETGKLTKAYGVNAETLVGKFILGEQLGIYNESGSLSFDKEGFVVADKNRKNSFRVDPNSDVLVAINNGIEDVFYIDSDGKLHITGDGAGLEIAESTTITDLSSKIDQKVSHDDLSTTGKTTINGSNITTGTLNANKVNITGTLNSNDITLDGYFEICDSKTGIAGGYLGFKKGESDSGDTYGAALANFADDCYAIVTDTGVRLQAGNYSVYVASNGAVGIKANNITIDGNLIVNGTLTHNNT